MCVSYSMANIVHNVVERATTILNEGVRELVFQFEKKLRLAVIRNEGNIVKVIVCSWSKFLF